MHFFLRSKRFFQGRSVYFSWSCHQGNFPVSSCWKRWLHLQELPEWRHLTLELYWNGGVEDADVIHIPSVGMRKLGLRFQSIVISSKITTVKLYRKEKYALPPISFAFSWKMKIFWHYYNAWKWKTSTPADIAKFKIDSKVYFWCEALRSKVQLKEERTWRHSW